MEIIDNPIDARRWTAAASRSQRVALVPTMGALHDGHLSLVRRAASIADRVVVSIFVNPTQFAPHEDLARYPRPFEADVAMLRDSGVAMVYHPGVESMYPNGFSTYVEPPSVATVLEGTIRPGHFRGVCTVVLKLFVAVPAQIAVFGQKDFQQSAVIGAMVRDLDLAIEMDVAATVRDADGLAMSSRNRYLSADERIAALSISRSLFATRASWQDGQRDAEVLGSQMIDIMRRGGIDNIDYAVVVDAQTLVPCPAADRPCVALIAARLGTTRLIDNVLLPV